MTEALAVPMWVAARVITGRAQDPREWRSGLILSHSHIGDVLYRTCSLPELHRGLPDCNWSFLTGNGGLDVLRNNPDAGDVLCLLRDDGTLQPGALEQLRSRKFDVVLCTNAFDIGSDLALSLRLKIPNRVALVFKGWSGLVTHQVRPPFPAPYPAYFRAMVESLTGSPAVSPLRPRIYWDAADTEVGAATLKQLALEDGFWVCAPGSRQTAGIAPLPVVERVFSAVLARTAGPALVIGSAAEDASLRRLAALAPDRVRILAGAPNIRMLTWILAQSRGALTQDSGPRHLANAAGVPVAFFRNLAVQRALTGVYCDTELDLSPPLDMLSQEESSACHSRIDAEAAARTIVERFGL